jgi:serine/threonine protein phosphatase PrpC
VADPAGACSAGPPAQVSKHGSGEPPGIQVTSGLDHQEFDLGLAAGVTDRGLRHERNEDALALAVADTDAGPAVLAVVCDGVSSTACPDRAAQAAAQGAATVLLHAAGGGEDPAEASTAAVYAAQRGVAELAGGAELGDAPSATYVSAIMTASAVTVCWLGDSRAYWLASVGARQLTSDDSIAEELIAAGLLSEAEALAAPNAHVITRWIGADLAEPEPHVTTFRPPGPGVLLLCSDGLWNYQPEAQRLAELALPAGLTDPLGAARALTAFAVSAGGRDNITVALAPWPAGDRFRRGTPGGQEPPTTPIGREPPTTPMEAG